MGAALAIVGVGLVTLFSASDQSVPRVMTQALIAYLRAGPDVDRRQRRAAAARARAPCRLHSFGCCSSSRSRSAGTVVNGSRRWLNLGIGRFQPSELMKIALPLMLAWYFQRHEAQLRLVDFASPWCSSLLPVWLIKRQPDLGTALMIGAKRFLRALPRRAVMEDHRRPRARSPARLPP